MPTYAYACTACGHRFEVQQSFTDDALTTCPECEGRLRKLFNSVGIVFKGSGFYRTDSRNGSSRESAAKESGSTREPASKESGSGEPGSKESGSARKESGSAGNESGSARNESGRPAKESGSPGKHGASSSSSKPATSAA